MNSWRSSVPTRAPDRVCAQALLFVIGVLFRRNRDPVGISQIL